MPNFLDNGRFNPRTHVGCDLILRPYDSLLLCFNPRTHVGCDDMVLMYSNYALMFQSTHPRRVRHLCAKYKDILICFNPRTHVGCDLGVPRGLLWRGGFNPRTHVGCDLMNPQNVIIKYMFQSTHPRRVRQYIQQMSEYHYAKLVNLRKISKFAIRK